jgi:DNA-directed RNA polymerase III subunit RPC8
MFTLITIKDKVRIAPESFNKEHLSALEDEIHKKYSNKVIDEIGLCISMYDIASVGYPYIYPGDGASHTEVTFRMIIFRPELGQVLTGRVKQCNEVHGVQVSLKFFEDIWVPPHLLRECEL